MKRVKLLWILFVFIFGWGISQLAGLRTEYAVDQFYPEKHVLLTSHDEISRTFRLNRSQPYLIVVEEPEGRGWLNPEQVTALKQLTDDLQEHESISQIMSLTHIEGAALKDNEMIIGNIFSRTPKERWKEEILRNPLLYPMLVTNDFKSTMIIIESNLKEKMDLENFHEKLIEKIQRTFPKGRVYSAGVPLIQSRLSGIIQKELTLFLCIILILFALIFYSLFTHWTAIVSAIMTLISANSVGLALMSAFNIPVNAIIVTAPVIISVSVMSLLIHTLHLWGTKKITGKDFRERNQMAIITLREIGIPNALGIFTTAVGFMTLGPSQIPIISQYGITIAMILTGVALFAQLQMYLLLPHIRPRMRSWLDSPATWALWPVHHPVVVSALMGSLVLAGAILLKDLNFSFKLFDDLPVNDPIRTTTERIDKSFGGIVTFDVEAFSDKKDFWKEPKNLQRLSQLAEKLRKQKSVQTVVSVPDFFQGKIPDERRKIAETFFLFSMAEKNPLNSFMTEDGKTLRVAIRLNDLPQHELSQVKEVIKQNMNKAFPEISFKYGGMASYAHAINQEVARALILDFWHPLLLIALFLIPVFRSLKWALISCLPNFIPPMALITALVVTEQPIKPSIALIFSIAMGFAFNNTLYLLTRLKKLEKSNESDSLEKAILMEANPCFLESLIMFCGFSIFLFSDFNMNQKFGGFMLISIAAGFAADLMFLPALLKLCPAIYKSNRRIPAVAYGLVLALSIPSVHATDAKEILQKSQSLLESKDDVAVVEMKIIEENGETKSRSLSIKTLRDAGFSMLARIQSPADIKDMAFLGNVDVEGNEKQWIYLPSNGQVRRLVTGKTKAGVLGSEISPEDLNSEAVKASKVSMHKKDDQYYWVELTPTPGSSDYTKVISKISKSDFLPKITTYYINEKLKKTVSFSDYKKIGPVFRAHHMKVMNHFNGRSTEVILSRVRVNTGLNADDFSQSSLKDEE